MNLGRQINRIQIVVNEIRVKKCGVVFVLSRTVGDAP